MQLLHYDFFPLLSRPRQLQFHRYQVPWLAQAVDPESLERENNKDIDALGDRVHMLRQVPDSASGAAPCIYMTCDTCAHWHEVLLQLTTNIHGEVNSHNRVLDNLVSSAAASCARLVALACTFLGYGQPVVAQGDTMSSVPVFRSRLLPRSEHLCDCIELQTALCMSSAATCCGHQAHLWALRAIV